MTTKSVVLHYYSIARGIDDATQNVEWTILGCCNDLAIICIKLDRPYYPTHFIC